MERDLQTLVKQAKFPVYGLAGNPHNLTLHSIGTSWLPNEQAILNSISLGFSIDDTPHPPIRVDLTSYYAQDEYTWSTFIQLVPPHRPEFSLDHSALSSLQVPAKQRAHLGEPLVSIDQMSIASLTFSREIHHWPLPPLPAWFRLINEQSILFGEVLGLTRDELQSLLSSCIVVNERQDLLAQYQSEFQRFWEAIHAQPSSGRGRIR
ncbi:hypothetical protein EPA93_32250 [Ktedonosporobacter rubrisoli]|uniref:Uncharacterized protein n=1 Tax=Ktedonosporobacter rubrisoli TaxID=2509675 RepID=A0A4P6JXM2_KTERU|nr:hypothetical protein [Ktedonosporobacter rubrisoli]QBD80394.1 hypothetical protein EPA93_32250 [Ktedonosporobacter rubrisoli]